MPARPIRTSTILDAMILVAAMAGWLALTRHFEPMSNLRTIWSFRHPGPIFMIKHQFALMTVFLAIGLVALRLRHPRPVCRRLWRQPGFVACVAVLAGVALHACDTLATAHATLSSPGYLPTSMFWNEWYAVGPCLIGAWLMLGLTRRWKAEASTVDRLGRLVGLFWVVEFFVAEITFGRWSTILPRLLGR